MTPFGPASPARGPEPKSGRFPRLWRTLTALGTAVALAVATAVPAAAATSGAPVGDSVTLAASQATWITSREPAAAHDRSPFLSATASADRAFLAFPTAQLAAGKTIASATLTLRVGSTAATTGGFQVYPTSANWKAASLTALNRPVSSATPANTALVKATAESSVSIPVRPSAIATGRDTGPSRSPTPSATSGPPSLHRGCPSSTRPRRRPRRPRALPRRPSRR
ncbi:hypothetical protein O159_24780 [Leifsonia xyli subsp. cynodontis DSM 46306]|uniref:Carbohydrate-binding module family 96 domain-containing protein n=1 Tax=Leifsonia xyli subsp. cynodontis DSM 46306 TaxID=1389489 RepID=U3PA83_LEIXC|nr:DNRLRE domain-containing protein [Leifsonia xyli]AGW42414.1 hypothetical protein O159_24780 [Leifsonia xyli subsp. cynodontis DSM 46306]